MAQESELKFQIPAHRLAALRRAVATARSQQQTLAARYVDTADKRLAHARCALRLRREDAVWVQTLKAQGDGPLDRLEHEVTLPPGAEPLIDIRRHDGSEAGAVLARVLGAAPAGGALNPAPADSAGRAASPAAAGHAGPVAGEPPPLQVRYATQVRRTRRLMRTGGAQVELALDEGEITAGQGQGQGRGQGHGQGHGQSWQLPLCELELELKAGPPAALLALAQRWVQRYGLVLDTRSKSERGHHLAEGRTRSPPQVLRPLRRTDGDRRPAALRRLLVQTLSLVLAQASHWAGADDHPSRSSPGAEEVAHRQALQRGLRRLSAVLAVMPPTPAAAAGVWRLELKALRAALAASPGAASACLARPAVQRLWLQLLGFSLQA